MNQSLNSSVHNLTTVLTNCHQCAGTTSAIKAVKILGYSLILIVSLFGNCFIITIVARNRRMRTTVNYLIANMATSDLLMSSVAVPMQLTEIVVGRRRWLIGGTVGLISCKLAYILQDISTAVSIQSLVVISIDRYRGIVFPFRPAIITAKRCKLVIPLVWLSSMLLHSTYFYTVRLFSQNSTAYCNFTWAPDFDPRKTQELYMIIVSVLVILLPYAIIIVLYCRIISTLSKEGRQRSSSFSLRRHQENTKVFRYIFAIMAAFSICVLPLFVYVFLFYFVWKWRIPYHMEPLSFAVHFVLFSNAAITPLIVFSFNHKYRKGLKELLKTLSYCLRDRDGANLKLEDIELNNMQN